MNNSQPTCISLPYGEDMLPYYQSLSTLENFSLLESTDRRFGRFDIVTALAYKQEKQSENTSLPELCFNSNDYASDLPFQGGAIAAITYEYGALQQGMEVAGKIKTCEWLYHFQYFDWAIIVDHQLKQVSLFAANTRKDTTALIKKILKLWSKVEVSKPISVSLKHHSVNSAQYQQAIADIHHALVEGRCYQVNYTQRLELLVDQGDAWDIYKQIRQYNPVPYAAFIRIDEEAILSFSPERFLTISPEGSVLSSPIKGSSKRSADPLIDRAYAQSLLNSEKNRAENIMIVDLLRNDLSRICKPGSVKVLEMLQLQSYSAVHHLVSHIQGQLKAKLSPIDGFLQCFPGGSITGAPKIEAMRMINELEKTARGIYCGSIAYFSNHGKVDSNIAIRTMYYANNTLHVSAGGGIVIDSIWEEEFSECYTKLETILKALNIETG